MELVKTKVKNLYNIFVNGQIFEKEEFQDYLVGFGIGLDNNDEADIEDTIRMFDFFTNLEYLDGIQRQAWLTYLYSGDDAKVDHFTMLIDHQIKELEKIKESISSIKGVPSLSKTRIIENII